MMMIGVTLGFGGYVTNAALNQFGIAQNAGAAASAVQEAQASKLVSLVYSTVAGSQSCPLFSGYNEGTVLTVALYNYGQSSFSPVEAYLNSTQYLGTGYGNISPGTMSTFSFTFSSCLHAPGQSILLVDAYGDELELAT
jgi:hypothetical protein